MKQQLVEGDLVPLDLTPYWMEVNTTYRQQTEGKLQFRCVRWLIEHIIDSRYSVNLFPGTSMYGLLLSLPIDGKVNYTRTLHIAYDELAQVVSLELKVWPNPDLSSGDLEKAIKWSTTCQPTEVIDTFEHFLNEHSDWSEAVRQPHMHYLCFKDPIGVSEPQTSRIGDAFWKGIGNALSFIVPQQNPDFDSLLSDVDHWLVEYDSSLDETIREIGFDTNGKAIIAMPLERNNGYWTDNQLKLADYERFTPVAISAQDFEAAWWKFIQEWNRP